MAVIRKQNVVLTAAQIKSILLRHYRYRLSAIACTEYEFCDVFALWPKKKRAVEIEVKVSIADLKADFKKRHRIELAEQERRLRSDPNALPPRGGRTFIDHLYYALPVVLVEEANVILREKMPFAGLIAIPDPLKGKLTAIEPYVAKNPVQLRSTMEGRDFVDLMEHMAKRMSSELTTFHTRKYLAAKESR